MSNPEFIVAVPARFSASRLPGKPLRLLGGEPIVRHVVRRALASGAAEVVQGQIELLEPEDGRSPAEIARDTLQSLGTPTAVVSMPSWELFESQSADYRANVLGPNTVRVACEAAMRFGWDRYLGPRGGFVGMTGFGASGPGDRLYEHFGITAAAIVAEAQRLVEQGAN